MSLLTSTARGHTLQFDEVKHRYTLDGIIVPGVTTVLKGGYPESEALTRWRIKQGIKEYETKAKVNEAASVGTILHEYAYYIDLGKPLPDDMYQRIESHSKKADIRNCVHQFQRWKDRSVDKIIGSEDIIAGRDKGAEDEEVVYFAGKYDRLAERNGKIVLSDFKTSSGIYITQFMQLAAYAVALEYWKRIKVDALEVLRFGKKDPEFETKLIDDGDAIAELKRQFIRTLRTHAFRTAYDS